MKTMKKSFHAAGIVACALCGGLAGTALPSSAANAARQPKAIFFMLDGLRADALEAADAPNLKALRSGMWQVGYHGLWSRNGRTVPDAAPSSAANHTTLATGVTAARHGVARNGLTAKGLYDKWPTFLARIVERDAKARALFAYSWGENKDLGKHPRVRFLGQSDEKNAIDMPKIMAAPDAPDAVLYFIDLPDHFGHGTGFYPFGTGYLNAIHQADRYVGATLAAIASRRTFQQEDWFIAVTGDHGGYLHSHGMWGGHASTVPLIASARHFDQGRIAGAPHHYDLTATLLAHFGFDTAAIGLDGKVLGKAAPRDAERPLREGLVAFLPFDGGLANTVANGPKAKPFGTAKRIPKAFLGGGLHLDGGSNVVGGVTLEGSEKIKWGSGGSFTATLWARLPQGQTGDPVLFGNKNWSLGVNPGFVLTAAKVTPNNTWPGPSFNCGTKSDRKRLDLGAYHPTPNAWTFFAVVKSAEGVVTFFCGSADGRFNWISDDASDLALETGLPIVLGQDGTGRYRFGLQADMDEFGLWSRSLDPEEVRCLYEKGRQGLGLADLL